MAQIGFDFCVHSIMAWACTRALTTFVKYHDSFVFILLYIHDSSLSTWHDFIWTLDIRMIYLSVFLEEQGHFLCKSYFLSPVDSEYIHYFMHVAAKIFCLTGYWFIFFVMLQHSTADTECSMTFCAIFLIFASCWYHLTMWLFFSCVC